MPGIVAGLAIKTIFALPGERIAHLIDGFAGAVIGGGILLLIAAAYERFRKKEGLGGGDIKLMAMLGAFFGWQASVIILFTSSFIGAILGLILMVVRKKSLNMAIPFGPFIVSAGMLWLFFGYRFLNWYLHKLGGA